MNAFVLSTGRCGSTTFAAACRPMTNFTASHETERRRDYGEPIERYGTLEYPDNHIEIDNRLAWFLGTLDARYGKEAFYVHLLRDREEVAASHLNRWEQRKTNIMFGFAWGILTHPFEQVESLPDSRKLAIGRQYWDTVNDNIRLFLRDKPNQMTIWLPEIKSGFRTFWERIGAEGDLGTALSLWNTKFNASLAADDRPSPDSAARELQTLAGPDSRCILIDDGVLTGDSAKNSGVIPFLERDGEFWGPPGDDDEAIRELNRLRDSGATHVAILAHSFWWLDLYPAFAADLKARFSCVKHDRDGILFQLR